MIKVRILIPSVNANVGTTFSIAGMSQPANKVVITRVAVRDASNNWHELGETPPPPAGMDWGSYIADDILPGWCRVRVEAQHGETMETLAIEQDNNVVASARAVGKLATAKKPASARAALKIKVKGKAKPKPKPKPKNKEKPKARKKGK